MLKIDIFVVEKVSYNPLVLGFGGHETQKNNTPPLLGMDVGNIWQSVYGACGQTRPPNLLPSSTLARDWSTSSTISTLSIAQYYT